MPIVKLSPEELRKHKGLSFTGITTVFLCHDGQGHLFLAKRSKKARDEHGHWDPGAGGLKHGLTLEGNLRRELKEEYNVEPQEVEFIGYLDVFRKTVDGNNSHWLAMFFAVLVDPKKIKINEPDMFDDSGWFRLDNLPSPMHSQFDLLLSKHGAKIKQLLND